ncbi:MAG: peroxiredoxin family protein [Acidimicrobiales bacterium]
MTQLVQLQQIAPTLRAAGYEVFAVSNDTVERLADFADRHAITFPLLSDEDSAVIRAFGILNTLIQPGEGAHMRWYGIPYPGTYITDAHGVVVDKDFHQHHARRLSGPALVHRVLGTVPESTPDSPQAATDGPDVALRIHLSDPTLRLEVLSTLVCQLDVAPGLHVYASGSPEQFTPVTLQVHGHGLRFGPAAWPAPRQLDLPWLGLSVPVHEGPVTVTVPVTATSDLIRLGHGLDQHTAELVVRCTYQACDDSACGLPTELSASLTVPLATLVEPDGIKVYVDRIEGTQPGGTT